MRFRRVLLLIILLVIILGWIENQALASLWAHYKDVIALSGFVLVIALALWFLRSKKMELQPDPFFLNVTFFAFAAQCIRTIEAWQTGRANGWVWFWWGTALVLLGLELAVISQHEKLTIMRYEEQLERANLEAVAKAEHDGTEKKPWPPGEINRWAKLMVKISGTDFLPGSLWLLASVFEEQPKEKSKREAVSILPNAEFIRTSEYLTSRELTLPELDRKRFGSLYILFPALSWIVFILALFASRGEQ